MLVELSVLGSSGSYAAPGRPCSGYLVRSGSTRLWMDCGAGTFGRLQERLADQGAEATDLDAVVITHEHPDHCVDIYGLHVMLRYGLEVEGLPLYAPSGAELRLGALVRDWGPTFDWHALSDGAKAQVGEIALRFSRTDHPPPTFAVELTSGSPEQPKRLVYTADTGPRWDISAFDPGADLVLSEASYLHHDRQSPLHISAKEAGEAARAADARRLVLTHLWPTLDPAESAREGAEAFGDDVTMAEPGLILEI